ncbi:MULTISPECIES: hypothetical protein [unclassified Mucilaginibacter]|uniref:hypothetical protein n=1 Tax=unclassified Mucilaginibacter TaxID=2617802 RepID=UPI002AC91F93|nr:MULTISPECIES: hypothetical protein [unclassified Mucilaginibacter]MEB0278247.1 hypothetical protein [Mucilaginibacter sp. 10B2]MEB0300967.1 hypothetical protein [Mucilaginibacter sp. 5C4]WPX23893.1 hypothetical protein RHM67_01190 [Mucilaginibacter sp. 5C4]
MEYGEQYHVNYNLKKGFSDQMEKLEQEVTITSVVATTVGEKFLSNSMSIDGLFKYKKGD